MKGQLSNRCPFCLGFKLFVSEFFRLYDYFPEVKRLDTLAGE